MTVPGAYTFGDSELASARLSVLAGVFRQTTAGFIETLGVMPGGVVVDLGCGPGHTTGLLEELLRPGRLVAVDRSAGFVAQAAARCGPAAEVVCADVGSLPGSVTGADLIFARFLLTHLANPEHAVEHWLARLGPTGMIAVEEVESISAGDPILEEYLDLQRQMLVANHNQLEAGRMIDQIAASIGARCTSQLTSLSPSPVAAARMFFMNFQTWRARPEVERGVPAATLHRIANGLEAIADGTRIGAAITWQLRQAVLALQ